jgi:sugar/nucleoside kinase (ribokinase family)
VTAIVDSRVPQLLVVGHVTRDEIDGGVRLGGAASYAARAAARLGVDVGLVTVAPPDDPLLDELRGRAGLRVACAAGEGMTTFALTYTDGGRRLALRARARPIVPADIPTAWRAAPVAYVGPVAGECDRALITGLGSRFVGAGLQGWLREAGGDGAISPAQRPEAEAPPPLGAAIVSELDHPDAEAIAARFAASGATVAITRGARGATILTSATRFELPAAPAREVDPTGAGDVFGVVLTLRLAAGDSPSVAAAAAATAAARVVEGPGLGTL